MFVPLLISTKISMCFYQNFTIKKMERFSVGSELWNRDFVSLGSKWNRPLYLLLYKPMHIA